MRKTGTDQRKRNASEPVVYAQDGPYRGQCWDQESWRKIKESARAMAVSRATPSPILDYIPCRIPRRDHVHPFLPNPCTRITYAPGAHRSGL